MTKDWERYIKNINKCLWSLVSIGPKLFIDIS